jgi:Holliday junction resolvase-like predicted endonuclease
MLGKLNQLKKKEVKMANGNKNGVKVLAQSITPEHQAKIFLAALNWIEMNATENSFKCFGMMQGHLWEKFERQKRHCLEFYYQLDVANSRIFEEWLNEVINQFN